MNPPFDYRYAILSILETQGSQGLNLTDIVDILMSDLYQLEVPRDIVQVRVKGYLQVLLKENRITKIDNDYQTIFFLNREATPMERQPMRTEIGTLSARTNNILLGITLGTGTISIGVIVAIIIYTTFNTMFLVSNTKEALLKEHLTNLQYKGVGNKANCTQWNATEFKGKDREVCLFEGEVYFPVEELIK